MREKLKNVLDNLSVPYCNVTLGQLNAIQSIDYSSKKLAISLQLGYPLSQASKQQLQLAIQTVVATIESGIEVTIHFQTKILTHAVQKGLKPLPGVKNIIAIASGKGGVGKSTVTLNIATALSLLGAKVGILDADIYGPSQAHMLRQANPEPSSSENKLMPVICYGIQTMSIAYLVDPEAAMVWRGPMVTGAMQQLLHDTAWQDLDYLFIDLPPGTGDIQLTLAQKVPVSGALIVTTPQDLALIDVRRAMTMFDKVSVPILGIVENMSIYQCPQCGHEEALFGHGGGKKLADNNQLFFLGEIPLNNQIRQAADEGVPLLQSHPEGDLANRYIEIAMKLAAQLSLTAQDQKHKFPKIVIE